MLGATIRPEWWQQGRLETLLGRLRKAGCGSLELHDTRDFPKTVQIVLSQGFQLTLHAPTHGDFNGAFFEERKDQVQAAYRRFLDRSQDLAWQGNQNVLINFHGGQGGEGSEHDRVLLIGKEFVHWLAEIMNSAYPNLRGVLELLPYDPAYNRIGDSQEELLFLTKGLDFDRFGLSWDLGHYQLNTKLFSFDGPLQEEFLSLVKHTHIHEFNPQVGDHCPLGRGPYSLKPYLRELLKVGYTGIYNLELALEQARRFGDPWDELIRSLGLLQKMIPPKEKKH